MNGKQFVMGFGGLNALWCLSLVLAPLSLAPGTVVGLDGHANIIDHADRWAGLPLFARAVYTFGDLNCHQIAARSWTVGGNQVPVDVRMLSGFFFGNVGFALVLLVPTMARWRDEVAQVVPQRWRSGLDSPGRRMALLVGLAAVSLGPALIDVVAQLALDYESTNLRRVVTGTILGVGGGFLIGTMFDGLWGAPSGVAAAKDDGQRQHA